MEMSGSQQIAADRETVWAALNNPEVLKACIPGCQSLETTENNGFEASVQAKVGPVKANFKGAVTLSDIDAPNGYTISGEGKGGAAGFAKGGAKVRLEEKDGGTLLTYEVDAKVGGKLAQIGSRLINSTAKKMAGDFFAKFGEMVEPEVQEKASTPAAAEQVEEPVKASPTPAAQAPKQDNASTDENAPTPILGIHPFAWTIGLVGIVIGLIFGFSG